MGSIEGCVGANGGCVGANEGYWGLYWCSMRTSRGCMGANEYYLTLLGASGGYRRVFLGKIIA